MFYRCIAFALIGFCFAAPTLAQQALDATSQDASETEEKVFLKRTVAIARFTNETASRTTFLVDNSGDKLGKQASDILTARLASTGRFLMFERTDSDEIEAEKIIAGMQDEGISVDYLILGSVSEFGRSVESQSGVFSRTKTQKAYAKVNVRLVEVATGRIIYSQEGAGEATSEAKKTLGVGSGAGYDQSLTDKAISAAISQLVSSLVENLTKAEWRSYILAADQGSYIIAGGASQGIRQGDTFGVFKRGRIVKNPQTGANIELPGSKVATIRVEMSFGEDSFSEASIVSVVSGVIGSDFSELYVAED
jgi:curli biogenesis system outer membrane secretion channel CsgG